ncbi:MAG: 30S ribosomal protein S18 [Phycisphaerae bacterium]
MAKRKIRPGRGTSRRKKRARFQEQAKCRFCRDKVSEVDYKDLAVLTKLTTQQGKMFSRKRSGNCAKHQRSAKLAVKRARFLGLMPYVG